MKRITLLTALFLAFTFPLHAAEWRQVRPGDRVELPRDFYFQPGYRVQWWYFTGHLFDTAGREFGFELTFFAAGVQKRKYRSEFGVRTLYLSHAAVSDVRADRFLHQARADSGAYGFAGADSGRLRVWVDGDVLEGTPRRMKIRASAGEASFDLVLVPKKPPVLQGRQGYSRKSEESPEDASLYFSCTDLETSGSLRIGKSEYRVAGKSWFDRELFSRGQASNEAGWDWFALQLDDGREIMLYQLRKKDGGVDRFSSGTVVYPDGTYRHLQASDFSIIPTGQYRSEHTGIRYPSSWQIAILSEHLRLRVIPLMQDQEFPMPGLAGRAYWEGTCRVEGSEHGRAYAELTGY